MKIIKISIVALIVGLVITSCSQKETKKEVISTKETPEITIKPKVFDKRTSLKLNAMQKNHQLMNMRSHLEAVQSIITLLSQEKYDEASKTAYQKLGSTTEMKMMCASFGDKNFETLGLSFHKSADKMSEIFKKRNKNKSLEALSNTMNYCVKCHQTYRQ